MNKTFKKLFLLLLSFCLLLGLMSCGEEEKSYLLDVSISSTSIYEGEKIEYDVKVVEQNKNEKIDVDKFDVSSSDEEIVKITSVEIEGIKEGKATITISLTYDEVKLTKDIEIEVKKDIKPNTYNIEIECAPSVITNKFITLTVKETTENVAITEFEVFITDETVLEYTNGSLKGLKVGKTLITVTTTYKDFTLQAEKEIIVTNDLYLECNIPNIMFTDQEIKVEVKVMPAGELVDFILTTSNEDAFYWDQSSKIGMAIIADESTINIKANYLNNELTLEFKVEVVGALNLKIELESSDITVGDKVDYTVIVLPVNKVVDDYEFSTIGELIKVEKGSFEAVSAGKTNLRVVSYYLGVKVICNIDLVIKEFIPNTINSDIDSWMFVNNEITLSPYINPSLTEVTDFEVKIADTSILQFENNKLKALKVGSTEVEITTTYEGELLTSKYNVEVIAFADFTIEMENDLYLHEVVQYKVMSGNKELKNFKYESSNQDVLLCNDHVVYAKANGNAQLKISYTYLDKEYNHEVEVKISEKVYYIERITLNTVTGSNRTFENQVTVLSITKYPSAGIGNIVLSSSNESVAKVYNANGVNQILSVKNGQCVIEAKVENSDVQDEITIEVVSKKEVSEVAGARYYEENIIGYHELLLGVKETRYLAYTSTQIPNIDADGYSGLDEMIVNDKYYPQQVNILEVPSDKNIKVVPWANLENHIWSLTTVVGLISNYEKHNPGYKVIAAINGDFFDINANGNLPYQTTGENISDGEFYKTTNSFGDDGGTVGFTNNGTNVSLVASPNATRTEKMILAIYDENDNIVKEFDIDAVNEFSEGNTTSVYYGVYDSNKEFVPKDCPSGDGVFIIENAELALPNNPTDFYGKGTITANGYDNKALGKGEFCVVTRNTELLNYLKIGTKVRCQYEYTGEFKDVTSATGYNCAVYTDINNVNITNGNLSNRAPRTVVGVTPDGTLIMAVIDGRQGAANMYGADGTELAAMMKSYGCTACYNLDGGGSSTMVVRTEKGLELLNSPSDGRERSDGNCILIVALDPDYKTEVSDITDTSAVINVSTNVEEYKGFKTYVALENEYYEVINGKAEISGLIHNNDYYYQIYYKDNDGDMCKTLSTGTFKTGKSGFKLLGILLNETSESYTFNLNYLDTDSSSGIENMAVLINGFTKYMENGTITLDKKTFGEQINSLQFRYWFIDGLERKEVNLDGSVCYKFE